MSIFKNNSLNELLQANTGGSSGAPPAVTPLTPVTAPALPEFKPPEAATSNNRGAQFNTDPRQATRSANQDAAYKTSQNRISGRADAVANSVDKLVELIDTLSKAKGQREIELAKEQANQLFVLITDGIKKDGDVLRGIESTKAGFAAILQVFAVFAKQFGWEAGAEGALKMAAELHPKTIPVETMLAAAERFEKGYETRMRDPNARLIVGEAQAQITAQVNRGIPLAVEASSDAVDAAGGVKTAPLPSAEDIKKAAGGGSAPAGGAGGATAEPTTTAAERIRARAAGGGTGADGNSSSTRRTSLSQDEVRGIATSMGYTNGPVGVGYLSAVMAAVTKVSGTDGVTSTEVAGIVQEVARIDVNGILPGGQISSQQAEQFGNSLRAELAPNPNRAMGG
jgi:hypothetical protein